MTRIVCRLSLFVLVLTSLGAQELPVSRVVLFTSGVGFFEHSGQVTGSVTLPFQFGDRQINDLLKSLVLRDPQGAVGTVNYPSQDSALAALQSFGIDLSGPGGLAALLPQFRGLAVTLTTPEELTGKLVGTDLRQFADREETILTLSTASGLKTVPLSSVTGLRLLDSALNDELTRALLLLAGQHNVGKQTVQVRFVGTGQRPVSVGYISEAPVWKTSYRLDLSNGKPFLQAWAMVENTSEADWTNVRLSLVSGRPVSFIQDLYTPLFVQRPFYVPETEAGPAPRVNEGAPMAYAEASSSPAPAPLPSMAKSAMPQAASRMAEDALADYGIPLGGSGVAAASTGANAGELFEFTVASPVSLSRRQSALIPLSSGDVTAEKVSLYNSATDAKYPLNAVWVTNTTGLRLPAGPITVFDGGAYAGDSLTDSLLEGDRRLWTYATDLAITVDASEASKSETTKITLVKGVLNLRNELTWTKKYAVDNKATTKKTLLVEQAVRRGSTLASPTKVEEKTTGLYRFRLELPPRAGTTLEVVEKQTITETQVLGNWGRETLLAFLQRGGPLSASVKEALQKAADLKGKVDGLSQEISALQAQKTDEENGQIRIRSNLTAVGRDSTQGQTYLKRLSDSDAKIDQLATQLAEKRTSQAAAQKEWESWLRVTTVD